jgi:lysozyme
MVGCSEGVTPNTHWTAKEATSHLAAEMAKHEAAVLRLVKVSLTQCQFDALVSFSYNVGYGALGKSTLLKHLNAGDYARAASHFADWKRAGGKVLPGLVRRRAAEAEMFMREAEPDMPQKVDEEATKMKPLEALAKVGAPLALASGGGVTLVSPVDLAAQVGAWKGLAQTVADAGIWASGLGRAGLVIGAGVVALVAVQLALNKWGPQQS